MNLNEIKNKVNDFHKGVKREILDVSTKISEKIENLIPPLAMLPKEDTIVTKLENNTFEQLEKDLNKIDKLAGIKEKVFVLCKEFFNKIGDLLTDDPETMIDFLMDLVKK
jgi:hypothetical protein